MKPTNSPETMELIEGSYKGVQDSLVLKPIYRRLRGYSFDPSLSIQMETAVINETIYRIPWEDAASSDKDNGLIPGPIGEYLEVIDYDPASGCFYKPLNLNDPYILAQDGLPPSEGNPQFHQQMVYAVAMTTIRNFERALGRPALWSPREVTKCKSEFVKRLRVYPHALREANAYYSPEKKALLFGYFPANSDHPERYLPGGTVFTCLSHDIITHETTHALLDGMHRRFIEPSNPDTLAFHEAFADIVALFQHFSFPNVLRHQIAHCKGNLAARNLLGELAQQFGEAIGNYGALRSAIGEYNRETGIWEPHQPDPREYETETEPHARGAILVAAVFDSFLAIFNSRVADLMRIAGSVTTSPAAGDLHPDLVNRLSDEAAKTAQHVLNVCVRALDYCPPVDINFGDYLRAIITADLDLVPDDDRGYRIAFIEAFRRRGIYPRNVTGLSVESLCWPDVSKHHDFFKPLGEWFRRNVGKFPYFESRQKLYDSTEEIKRKLHVLLREEALPGLDLKCLGDITGMTFELGLSGLRLDGQSSVPKFEVHSLRPAQRIGPDGDSLNQLIISMIQSRDIEEPGSKMVFRGGCTLILDMDTMLLRYAITKSVTDENRLQRHREYHRQEMADGSPRATYFQSLMNADEPFALLHGSAFYGRP